MQTLRQIVLVSALLSILIFGPIVAAGYVDLSMAESGTVAHDQSVYYESAAGRLPWRPDLYEAAGFFAVQAGEYGRATALLETAHGKGVLTPGGRFELGKAYYFTDDQEKAIAEWKSLLNDGQQKGNASQYLAYVYHTRGEFELERQVLDRWLEFDPANTDARYGLALLLFSDASPDALALLESLASDSPSLKPHVDGLLLALKTAPDEPAGRLLACGRTLAALGEWLLAERTFSLAVQADPQNGLAWAWLGEARQQNGHDGPSSAFERAVTFAPDSAEIHAMFGLYWQRRENWQNALAEFQAAARLEPQNAIWHISLGSVYVQLGDLIEALGYYQSAVLLAPANPQTWRALALFSVENEVDIEGTGRAAALRAYALEPESAQNMDILGRTLMATEEWDSAEAIFKKAMAAAPEDAAPVFHLALLYLQTNKLDLAKQYLQSAQALDPDGAVGAQAARVLARYFP